jgi:hypothetical protein
MTSRIQILNTPVAAPGTCVICGSAGDDNRSFIDFGLNIDYFGVIYFCTICFAEIAVACNFVDNTHYRELLQRNQELTEALEQAQLRNESLNDTFRKHFAGDSPVDTLRDTSDHYEVSRTLEGSNQYAVISAEDVDESSDVEELGSILDAPDIDISAITGTNPLKF